MNSIKYSQYLKETSKDYRYMIGVERDNLDSDNDSPLRAPRATLAPARRGGASARCALRAAGSLSQASGRLQV